MKRFLYTFIALLTFGICLQGQTVIEDFEDGGKLRWDTLIQGSFAIVANPEDTTGRNPSPDVGSYTKDTFGFSLFRTFLETPLDLSLENEFSIQVYAGEATSFIFKLQGPGQAIEARTNIPVANQWRTYTFDFSQAAGLDSLNQILIFFDPGDGESTDTYLVDNIIQNPEGPCAGTVPDPTLLDDFECQRNATYGVGFDSLTAVPNPDASGINTSSTVGRWGDPPNNNFSALVLDYEVNVDLTTNNQLNAKVWAPAGATTMGFKLEGGASPAVETTAEIPESETWIQYSIDFSDQANANHKRVVLFFGFNESDTVSTVWYVDDISFTELVAPGPLEDFEEGGKLIWTGTNGTFDGPIANPDASGENTSANIGSFAKSAALGQVSAALPEGIDLSVFPQVNLQVWAPAGATEVRMSLVSPLEGVKSATAPIEETETWVNLGFDFTESQDITDFDQVQLIFDPGIENTSAFFFDNLSVGQSTVDPCLEVDSIPTAIDDFECQRNYDVINGGNQLEVVVNPDVSDGNPSTTVGKYTDPDDQFSALSYSTGQSIDLSIYNILSVKIWSPAVVPLGFKLEGGSSAPFETTMMVSEAGEWIEYLIPFTDQAEGDFQTLSIFFNFGVAPGTNTDEYFIDDVKWVRPTITGCIANFEEPAFSVPSWQYFANGDGANSSGIQNLVVPNPDQSGINMSETVAQFIETPDGNNFAGAFSNPNPDAPFNIGEDRQLTAKIWMPVAGRVVLKVEQGLDGAPSSGDIFSDEDYDTPGQWKELTWTYTLTQGGDPIPANSVYQRLTIIPNFDEIPEVEQTHFFDDIAIKGGDCANPTVNIFNPVRVETFRMFPNPAYDRLTVEKVQSVRRYAIFNNLGQRVMIIQDATAFNVQIDIQNLNTGMYYLNGYNDSGKLVASGRFIKR